MIQSSAELKTLLDQELCQRQEEGCDIAGWSHEVRRAGRNLERMEAVYQALMALEPAARLERAEPSDLRGIRRLSPRSKYKLKSPHSSGELRRRLQGAMLGRCAGCTLGKPVEGWLREDMFNALKKDGRFPLRTYIAPSTVSYCRSPENNRGLHYCTLGHIHCMERDDDTDYTILGVHYLKTFGRKFTTQNVADEWLWRLPYHRVFTAERAAYRNLIAGLPLKEVPIYRNPYREWIGAQIRADGFGYCAAGVPMLAAEFAYRDAALSHVKNGIYGEMLFAAMIAAAAVSVDLHEVIEIGLAHIPAQSRLALAVRDVIEWSATNRDWMQTFDAITQKFGHYHWVHTINNAAVVVMALLHGKMDYGKTICMAVMGGWDTDCNGATAGSVLGAMLGADRLPSRWIAPLRNKLRSDVVGYDNSAITDIADRAVDINGQLRKEM